MAKRSIVIVLEVGLVKSRAWLSLTGAATQVYLLFRTKCQMGRPPGKPGKRDWTILNNGELVFTYREARRKYGLTASRFRRALEELIGKGFIDVTGTGMGVHKVATVYAVSNRWHNYGTPAFCETKRPKPSIRNPGFRPGNKLWRMAVKKKTSVANEHGVVRENEHGDEMAVRETAHGDEKPISRKTLKDKELSHEVAQVGAVRTNDTVL